MTALEKAGGQQRVDSRPSAPENAAIHLLNVCCRQRRVGDGRFEGVADEYEENL
jgi:hypothetical protein